MLETQDQPTVISDVEIFRVACTQIASGQKATYERIVAELSTRHGNNKTDIYTWILKYIKANDIPDIGIKNAQLHHGIKEMGGEAIQQGTVTGALNAIIRKLENASLPIVFEYDDNKNFYVLDKYFVFVLRWCRDLL